MREVKTLAGLAACMLSIAACAPTPPRIHIQATPDGGRVAYITDPAEHSALARAVGLSSDLAPGATMVEADRLVVQVPAEARRNMYPLLAPVGEGSWFVYAPALLPNCLASAEILVGPPGAERRTACRADSYLVAADTEAVVLGPRDRALTQTIEDAAGPTMASLARRLGPAPSASTAIGVTISPAAPSSLVAHVDRAGSILFEARPGLDAAAQDVARTQIRPLLRHEMFHRWNMAGVSAAEGTPTWFYEGAAEYAGGLMSLEEGDFSAAEHDWLLAMRLNRCQAALGPDGLAAAEPGRVVN